MSFRMQSRLLVVVVNLLCGSLSRDTCDIWVIALSGNYRLALPAAIAAR